ncbi:MAG: hypothetical protein LBV75_00050 [Paludibacter sp.]|jgi:uncharacterized protein YxjI|nr:hypothetical protein [Paludibacter sp.]
MSNYPTFFNHNIFFIDEKVAAFKFTNTYKVFDSDSRHIGNIKQKMSAGLKVLSLFLNKAMFPFRLDIIDNENNLLASVTRGWTFFMSTISVSDSDANTIAIIKQKFKFFKPEFRILDIHNEEIAIIKGDWKAWNFSINDSKDKLIGTINKKWAGVFKETFTTADKYIVSIEPDVAEDSKKIAIVATAITIDMVLKESK